MTIEEIKELIEVFKESGLGELELQRGEDRLRVKRASMSHEYVVAQAPQIVTAAPGYPPAYPPAAPPAYSPAYAEQPAAALSPVPASSGGASPAKTPTPEGTLVRSPIVGTYYDAPSPDAAPFVRVGDSVEPGQVLCIIESMKLMNEIEAEVAGVIAAKLVENGRPVEYGEALFSIKPK